MGIRGVGGQRGKGAGIGVGAGADSGGGGKGGGKGQMVTSPSESPSALLPSGPLPCDWIYSPLRYAEVGSPAELA